MVVRLYRFASAKFDDMLFYWRIYEGQASFSGLAAALFGTFTNFIKDLTMGQRWTSFGEPGFG